MRRGRVRSRVTGPGRGKRVRTVKMAPELELERERVRREARREVGRRDGLHLELAEMRTQISQDRSQ